MLTVWVFVYKKLAQFAVRGALPPRRSESPGCAADNKTSCMLHLLGSFIGSRGFSSLEQRPEFWVLHYDSVYIFPDVFPRLNQTAVSHKYLSFHHMVTRIPSENVVHSSNPLGPRSAGIKGREKKQSKDF